MKLIDTAVSHFSSKAVRSIEVPEWETTLYAKNLTLDDKAKWFRRADGDTTDFMVYSLIFGLQDANGEQVFTIEDKHNLRKNADPVIVSRLADFVLESGLKEESREKN
jgi:hypothetical protein